MCTVSFIPCSNGIIITHNRDEKRVRTIALPPTEKGNVIYPVDTFANGTWFIVSRFGDASVLLNGAFEKHISAATYKMSRGLILPIIFDSSNPLKVLQTMDLHNIEPFTIVLYLSSKLYQCKWNGINLSTENIDATKPSIWSSVTLYSKSMIDERECWFKEFIACKDSITQTDMIRFHSNTNSTNAAYGLQINRNNEMLTVSITSVYIHKSTADIYYKDCIRNAVAHNTYNLNLQQVHSLA